MDSQGRIGPPHEVFHSAGVWTESFEVKDKIGSRAHENYASCCRCEVCHKLFSRLGDLKSHLWIHTKQKPYSQTGGSVSKNNHRRKTHREVGSGSLPAETSSSSSNNNHHEIQSSQHHLQMRGISSHEHNCHIQNELLSRGQTEAHSSQSHHSHIQSRELHCQTPVHHQGQTVSHPQLGPESVASHNQNEDNRKRSNPCDTCGKSFSFSNYLSLHKSVHTKEKNFSCDLCPKKFSQPSSRNRHRKKTHKQERCEISSPNSVAMAQPHQNDQARGSSTSTGTTNHQKKNSDPCQVCGKIFAFKNYMKSHLRVHSKEKPYACDLCFRRFTQASSRNFHRKRMHKEASLIEPTPQQMAMQPPVSSSLQENQPNHDEKPAFHCKTCVPSYTPYKQ